MPGIHHQLSVEENDEDGIGRTAQTNPAKIKTETTNMTEKGGAGDNLDLLENQMANLRVEKNDDGYDIEELLDSVQGLCLSKEKEVNETTEQQKDTHQSDIIESPSEDGKQEESKKKACELSDEEDNAEADESFARYDSDKEETQEDKPCSGFASKGPVQDNTPCFQCPKDDFDFDWDLLSESSHDIIVRDVPIHQNLRESGKKAPSSLEIITPSRFKKNNPVESSVHHWDDSPNTASHGFNFDQTQLDFNFAGDNVSFPWDQDLVSIAKDPALLDEFSNPSPFIEQGPADNFGQAFQKDFGHPNNFGQGYLNDLSHPKDFGQLSPPQLVPGSSPAHQYRNPPSVESHSSMDLPPSVADSGISSDNGSPPMSNKSDMHYDPNSPYANPPSNDSGHSSYPPSNKSASMGSPPPATPYQNMAASPLNYSNMIPENQPHLPADTIYNGRSTDPELNHGSILHKNQPHRPADTLCTVKSEDHERLQDYDFKLIDEVIQKDNDIARIEEELMNDCKKFERQSPPTKSLLEKQLLGGCQNCEPHPPVLPCITTATSQFVVTTNSAFGTMQVIPQPILLQQAMAIPTTVATTDRTQRQPRPILPKPDSTTTPATRPPIETPPRVYTAPLMTTRKTPPVQSANSREFEATANLSVSKMSPEEVMQLDQDGDSKLHIAIDYDFYFGKAMLFRLIRDNKLQHFINHKNLSGKTPLYLAVHHEYEELVAELIKYGADPNIEAKIQNQQTGEMNTRYPLHLAAMKGFRALGILDLLLNAPGVNVNATSYDGLTALHLAITRHGLKVKEKNHLDMKETIQKLLLHGAQLRQSDQKSGRTPIHHLVEKKDADLLEFVLNIAKEIQPAMYNPNKPPLHEMINATTYDMNTPLHLAAGLTTSSLEDHIRIIRLLLANGADRSARNMKNQSPRDMVVADRADRKNSGHSEAQRAHRQNVIDILRGKTT